MIREPWENIFQDFLNRMQELSNNHGCRFREGIFEAVRGKSRSIRDLHVYTLSKLSNQNTEVWISPHVSLSARPFWGVPMEWIDKFENLRRRLTSVKIDWAVALLTGGERGYFLNASDFMNLRSNFSISRNNYKINEKDLNSQFKFWGYEELFDRLGL